MLVGSGQADALDAFTAPLEILGEDQLQTGDTGELFEFGEELAVHAVLDVELPHFAVDLDDDVEGLVVDDRTPPVVDAGALVGSVAEGFS